MKTAKIFDFATEKAHREEGQVSLLAQFDVVECFKCEGDASPVSVSADFEVTYCCPGYKQHRKFYWRFDKEGDLMYGRKGTRYYP